MPKKKTIALFTSNEGHYSIAQAMQQALEKDYRVVVFREVNDILKLYVLVYQFFPGSFKLPYKLMQNQHAVSLLQSVYKKMYQRKIERFCAWHRPDVCISTYFMFNPMLEEMARQHPMPFINVITDPRTIHPLLVSSTASTNLVFDEVVAQECRRIKDDPTLRTDQVGWFVRDQFETITPKAVLRKRLKLDQDKLTFLISSGSEGTTHVLKILPILISSEQPIQVVVACGGNDALYRSVKALDKIMSSSDRFNRLVALRFVHNLQDYVQAADLVIGKAGPNSLFESVASHTPFFAITHIAGQEDGNLDIIKEYKLGFVEENALRAQRLLRKIINQPQMLTKFQPHLEKMAVHNQQAKTLLLKKVAALIAQTA